MNNNYYLTPNEQRIMETIGDSELAVTEDIIGSLPGIPANSVKNAISSLSRKGRLYRLRRGFYLRCEHPGIPLIGNPEKTAQVLFGGYVAFGSALRHWNLLEYEPFTVFVVTRTKGGTVKAGNYTFRAVSMGRRAAGAIHDRGVYVSSLEKTIFDCIYKPSHAGGYPLVAKAIRDANPDWKKVQAWFDRFGTVSLKRRAGYVLSKAGAPSWLLEHFRKGATYPVWLDPGMGRKAKYDSDWKVLDNVGGWDGNR
jgi:predicted transcriptional regulator of viral defense system